MDKFKFTRPQAVAGILAAVVIIGGAAWYANAKSADGSDAKGKTEAVNVAMKETGETEESTTEPETQTETVVETQPETEQETIPEIQTEPESETEPETEPESVAEIQTEPETEPETEPQTEAIERVTRPANSMGTVICLDPGHQSRGNNEKEPNGPGSSTMKTKVAGGTSGTYSGVAEYELTLAIGLQLRDELQNRGYTVVMTRESNEVNLSNKERADIATEAGADLTIRIHADGVDNSSVSGASVLSPTTSNPYIADLAGASWQLSECILNAYCEATGMKNRGVTGNDTMTGINWSTNPVALIELGFMTNATDDANMQDATYQERMVYGIANGVDVYLQK